MRTVAIVLMALAPAVGGADRAPPVQGDPGISSTVVMDGSAFRALRDYADRSATRRRHNDADALS